jgi:hypothetical protein
MSSTLYCYPDLPPKGIVLDDELKFKLRDKWDSEQKQYLDRDFIPYLEGLRDGGVKGADKLIKQIKKYGEVIIEFAR